MFSPQPTSSGRVPEANYNQLQDMELGLSDTLEGLPEASQGTAQNKNSDDEDDEGSEVFVCEKNQETSKPIEEDKKDQDSEHIKENIASTYSYLKTSLSKIFGAVESIQNTCTEALKLVAQKHRVSTNPLMMEFGQFSSIDKNNIEIDHDGIKIALVSCKNIEEVFVFLPFLGLNDDSDKIICEFCPNTQIQYFPDNNPSSHRFGNTKTAILKHSTSQSHKQNLLKEYKKSEEDKVILTKDERAGKYGNSKT